MLGIGLGLTVPRRAQAALAPIGSQIVFWGDGTMAENSTPGLRCPITWTMFYLCGRVMPSPAYMQAGSGGDLDTFYARRMTAIRQKADIAVFTSQGHNDGLMSTDPDLNPAILNKWKRNLDVWIDGNSGAYAIPVCSTLGSTVSGETQASNANPGLTRRQRVWQLQQAYVEAKADRRIYYVATGEAYDPPNMSMDSGGFYTHMDERGGYAIGFGVLGPAIGARVVAATKEDVLQMLYDGTYPGLVGGNIDGFGSLTGSGGTKTAATGSYANGKVLTNNLGGTSVVTASKDVVAGRERQIVTITGTPAAEGNILQTATSNVVVSATPGRHALLSVGLAIDNGSGGAPVGLKGLQGAFGNYGIIGRVQDSAGLSGPVANRIDTILMVPPKAFYSSSTQYGAKPACDTRWANAALTGRTVLDRMSLRLIDTRTRSAPGYIGNDTIQNDTAKLSLTGTLTSGAGTLRLEPGAWAPYGLTEADFMARRIYKGGGAGNANIGAGVLMATLTGGAWTWTASGVVAGDQLFAEITVNNGTGGDVVERSDLIYVAT